MLQKSISVIDVGFGDLKALRETNGILGERVVFPSIYSPFHKIRYDSGLDRLPFAERLTVRIADEDGTNEYFVGKSAATQGKARASTEGKRTLSQEGKLYLLTALGLLAPTNFFETFLVVGLPVSEYNEITKNEYISLATGKHEIEFIDYQGRSIDRKYLIVKETRALPQPIGTVYSRLFDEGGAVKKDVNPTGNIGVADIGFRTSDLARMENLVYIDKASESFTGLGVVDVCKAFRQALIDMGIDYISAMSEAEMIPYLKGEPVKVKGKEIDVSKVKRLAIEAVGEGVVSAIVTKWSDWKKLDHFFVSGGGAVLFEDFLKEKFGDEFCHTLDQWGNVTGYLYYGKRVWK